MSEADIARLFLETAQRIEDKFDQTTTRIETGFQALRSDFGRLEQRFDGLERTVDGLGRTVDGLDQRVSGLEQKVSALDEKIDVTAEETRRHFDILLETFDSKTELLAEGIRHSDQKLERRTDEFEKQMIDSFAETHALIRMTYRDLDQRVRAKARRARG